MQGFVDSLSKIWGWMPALLRATGITISLTASSVMIALVLAVFLALGKISSIKPLRALCSAYIFFFRGTPLLLQLFFIYYSLPQIIPGLSYGAFTAALIAFSLNIAAYLAEIIRAAIQSIDKGQLEAAKSLGLTRWQAMSKVILPQAYRRMLPPICNEFVMVLKDTSLVSIVALLDLTFQSRSIASSSASPLVYIPCAILYLLLTGIFTVVFNRLEKKFSVYES